MGNTESVAATAAPSSAPASSRRRGAHDPERAALVEDPAGESADAFATGLETEVRTLSPTRRPLGGADIADASATNTPSTSSSNIFDINSEYSPLSRNGSTGGPSLRPHVRSLRFGPSASMPARNAVGGLMGAEGRDLTEPYTPPSGHSGTTSPAAYSIVSSNGGSSVATTEHAGLNGNGPTSASPRTLDHGAPNSVTTSAAAAIVRASSAPQTNGVAANGNRHLLHSHHLQQRGHGPQPSKLRVLMLMSDTGGGHRASSQALETALEQLYPGKTSITTVDFWTSVAGFPFHRFPAQYTYLAKRPMLWYFVYLWALFPPTRWLTEVAFSLFCHAKVRRYFETAEADVIVSVHPLVNTLSLSVLGYMRRTNPERTPPPFVTVVTDLGGAHPTWFDKRADMVYVPSEPLRQLAIDAGVQDDRIRLFGLPIRASFWTEARSRDELRKELGMALNMPAVLLVGGGDGVGGLGAIAMAVAQRIAEDVGDAGGQLVVVCGKNKRLLYQLQSQSWPIPVVLKGFVKNMSEWMSACDILCSKAGPGTIAEGWTRGLPIIISGFLPGQEEGNVKLVTEAGTGEFHGTPESIAECAARWVRDPELRGAVASRARELGRPNSTRQIAADVWELTLKRKVQRDAYVARQRAATAAQGNVPNGYIAMARFYIANGVRMLHRSLWTLGGRQDAVLLRPQ